ncbi:MAG: TonB-dependent receptor [Rhodocyclaceae bacterium]|nr:MAG: TonB-dependent receptor [Rhodocyclaceae bacterium]
MMKTLPFKQTTLAAAFSTLLIAPISTGVFAQQAAGVGEEKVDRITITTTTRSPKAVDKIPGAITVISPEEIVDKMKLTQDATAILTATVPGYSESSQNMASNGETLRGRTALRLFDGVPQTIPLRDGNRTSTFTDMSIIERIEVINGPSAAEGIGASGGIINYLSKRPTKMGTEVSVTSQYETQWREDSGGWKLGFNIARKEDAYDLLLATSASDRGMEWDANGRRIGMGQSGSSNDSESKNMFAKLGINFGANGEQRLAASVSHFNIRGKGNYIEQVGNRTTGLTDTAIRASTPGGQTEFNEFNQSILTYTHSNLLGGMLNIQGYRADQHTRFLSECGTTDCLPLKADNSNLNRGKQDPLFAPLGSLVEASETMSQKNGVRSNWSTDRLAGIQNLELNAGVDIVEDTAQQKLALTNRVWVPPMQYKSNAPFAQLSYNAGPVTVSGGMRRENGELVVDDYTTVWAVNRAFVKGGTLEYSASLPNVGVVVRLPQGWSGFASYSKGFTLPNVGIPLRNVSVPGRSVKGLFADLQAVISDNKEVGFTWRGKGAYLSASAYRSYSELGASIAGNATVGDYVLTRKPVEIKGYELSGEYSFSKALKANALYSHMSGMTSATQVVPGLPLPPLAVQLNANDISPNKLNASVTWKYSEVASARLGSMTLFDLDTNIGNPLATAERFQGYTLFDLSLNYDLRKYGNLSLGIDNLLNKQYYLAFSSHDLFQNYFAGRGRKMTLSHNIKF